MPQTLIHYWDDADERDPLMDACQPDSVASYLEFDVQSFKSGPSVLAVPYVTLTPTRERIVSLTS